MIERAVPRWPGPKYPFYFYVTTSAVGITQIQPAPTTGLDYWIETVDVTELVSGGTTSNFNVLFFNPNNPGGVQYVFFGNQVNANTGLFFQYRGPLQWTPGQGLYFQNGGGTWACYVHGFITSSTNE